MNKLHFIIDFIIIIIIAAFLLSSCSGVTDNDTDQAEVADTYLVSAAPVSNLRGLEEEVRGVWIASVHNINFPSKPDLSGEALRSELNKIVETVKAHGMNTVFFQVHPAADALYRSDIYPVSKYLYTDGVLHFDPLQYMVDICKESEISLYAWVNPLRVTASSAENEEDAAALLPAGSPGKDKDMTVFYGDGKLYFDCGQESVRNLVCDTVDEIVTRYKVDGVVFDDYFYPYPVKDSSGKVYVFDDSDTFAKAKTKLSRDDWRRDNVNQMIKSCYTRIKSIDPDVQFGVSPFGIWKNVDGDNGGSKTSGMEAYYEIYCDATAWIKGKYVDFISPQLYWECEDAVAPFTELVSFWSTVADGYGVDLLVSHGIYQYDKWNNDGEINRQIDLSRDHISYKGSILYGYEALTDNTAGASDDTADAFKNSVYYYHAAEYPENIMLSVSDSVVARGNTVQFEGYSDPGKALTVNGVPVDRSCGGYFRCDLSLSDGENVFLFVCGDEKKEIKIIK